MQRTCPRMKLLILRSRLSASGLACALTASERPKGSNENVNEKASRAAVVWGHGKKRRRFVSFQQQAESGGTKQAFGTRWGGKCGNIRAVPREESFVSPGLVSLRASMTSPT